MNGKYLTLEQNICSARIFLNIFGLTLENTNDINEFSKLKIFDKDKNIVGKLHFNNGKVILSANYNNCVLDASYDMAKMLGFVDVECGNALFALFSSWSSKIAFQVQKSNNITLSGEILIGCSVDTEFGISCLCHPLIKCEVPSVGNIFLKILRDGSTFRFEIVAGGNYEIIDLRPWDCLNGFFLHDIKKGEYDDKIREYPYRRYAGIFNGAEVGEDKDKLHVFLSENEYKNQLTFRNEFLPKVGDDNSKEALLQKGKLMQDLDPDMYDKIKKLTELLKVGDISVLDNLVSVCYDSYTDEELSALLGVNRQKMNYQNGADSLVNSYFEIGRKDTFFPIEEQQRLISREKINEFIALAEEKYSTTKTLKRKLGK